MKHLSLSYERRTASIVLIAIVLLMVGCSNDRSMTLGPSSTATVKSELRASKAGFDVNDTVLGPTPRSDAANGPAPGLEFLPMPGNSGGRGNSSLDDDCTYQEYEPNIGREVKQGDHGCYVPPWALDYPVEISVCEPDEDLAMVDFSPHPTQFNFGVMIWISFKELGWNIDDPETWEGVSMWYVNDYEEWELLPHYFDWENEQVSAITNHFSRYILAKPLNDSN